MALDYALEFFPSWFFACVMCGHFELAGVPTYLFQIPQQVAMAEENGTAQSMLTEGRLVEVSTCPMTDLGCMVITSLVRYPHFAPGNLGV